MQKNKIYCLEKHSALSKMVYTATILFAKWEIYFESSISFGIRRIKRNTLIRYISDGG